MKNLLEKKNLVTKKDIKIAIEEIKQDLDVAKINPLEGAIFIKIMEDFIKLYKADKDITNWTLEEAELYGKSFEYQGYEMVTRQAGTKYEYNDTVLDKINEQIKELTEKKKEREKMLQNLSEDADVFDTETGEKLHKAIKTSHKILTIKIK